MNESHIETRFGEIWCRQGSVMSLMAIGLWLRIHVSIRLRLVLSLKYLLYCRCEPGEGARQPYGCICGRVRVGEPLRLVGAAGQAGRL